MSILNYIKKYGDSSFSDLSFSEVDNLILASLSYLNLTGIVEKRKKVRLEDVYFKYLEENRGQKEKTLAGRHAFLLLQAIAHKKRYQNILLSHYIYVGDLNQQFSALSLDIDKDTIYISFEGTDDLISGWKEDFELCYKFPVLAQKQAIRYLNLYYTFSLKKIILGGHSKGGNLALVSSMYANPLIQSRIIKIYNNDGPGLREKEFLSKKYQKVEAKIIHIVPNFSLVGLLLYHSDNYMVIQSNRKDLMAHDFLTWQVDDNKFKQTQLSNFSKILAKSCLNWVQKYDDKKKEVVVETLFSIFNKLKIDSYNDILENKRLFFDLIKETGNIDKETKEMVLDLFNLAFLEFKTREKEKINQIFPQIKKEIKNKITI